MINDQFFFGVNLEGNTNDLVENLTKLGQKYWIHLNVNDPITREWLNHNSSLQNDVIDKLMDSDSRPQISTFDEGLFITLRGINFNEGSEKEDMIALNIWIDKDKIITTRNQRILAINETKQSITSLSKPITPVQIFLLIVRNLFKNINKEILNLDLKNDELEQQLIDNELEIFRTDILNLRRTIISLKKYILPQKDIFLKLQNINTDFFDKKSKIKFKELTLTSQSIIDDLATIREKTLISQEEYNSKVAEDMNKTIYLFSIITALFLPLSFITGLLGINVGGMPGVDNKLAFFIVCAILLIIGVLELLLFKRKKFL